MKLKIGKFWKDGDSKPFDVLSAIAKMQLLDLLTPKDFKEAVDEWLIELDLERRSQKTIRWYKQHLYEFNRLTGNQKVHEVQAIDVKQFFRLLRQKGDHPHKEMATYKTLRVFFTWCKDQHYLVESPLTFRPPKVPIKTMPILEPYQIRAVIEACKESSKPGRRQQSLMEFRDRALILGFLDTGARLEEMALLKLTNFDMRSRRLTVMGKGKKQRVVGVSDRTTKALWNYLKRRNDAHDALWVSEEQKPLTPSGIQQIIRRVTRRALGRKVGPHCFRHTFACYFLLAGGGELDLMYILGHTSLRMVELYSRAARQRKALDNQGKSFLSDWFEL